MNLLLITAMSALSGHVAGRHAASGASREHKMFSQIDDLGCAFAVEATISSAMRHSGVRTMCEPCAKDVRIDLHVPASFCTILRDGAVRLSQKT